MEFLEWLRQQYGPGTQFASARQLSLAISDGRNQGAVGDMENRGLSRLDTAVKLAETTSTSLLEILVMAGYLPEEQLKGQVLSEEEDEILRAFRRLSAGARVYMLGSLSGILVSEGDQVRMRRAAEEQGSHPGTLG